jgi:hypothetical protein
MQVPLCNGYFEPNVLIICYVFLWSDVTFLMYVSHMFVKISGTVGK